MASEFAPFPSYVRHVAAAHRCVHGFSMEGFQICGIGRLKSERARPVRFRKAAIRSEEALRQGADIEPPREGPQKPDPV